jgi:hypothetical protein
MAKSKGRLLSELVESPKNEDYADVNSLPDTGNKVGDQAFVEASNRLYIWNGSGWYNIALINTAPSITSNHDSSYNLLYNTPLNISVSATDPEGLNLNYSYNTSDSIGNVATITNDSSQFTITPSNNYAVEGTFSLAFRASDGVNIATAGTSTFTLANQAPSLSGNSASYILSVDGSTATVITLTSVDPEGQPITYSATGDSGFNSIATVSNDSSVFTITPKNSSQAPGGGTGNLTFTASDGIKSTNATSSFTLTFMADWSSATQQAKLAASDAAAGDAYGKSVSISGDGNTVIVGAHLEDTGGTDAGSAYIFTRSGSTWSQEAKIQSSDVAQYDYFGRSVSISSDGDTVIVAAVYDDDASDINSGSAYIFTRSGTSWSQQAKIQASNTEAQENFGHSVSISNDGNTAIIGAIGSYYVPDGANNAGSAFVFTRSGTSWSQQAKIQPSDIQADDRFGAAVSISGDGNTAIIGANKKDTGGTDAGAAYIYTRSGTSWSQQAKILSSDRQSNDEFGSAVSISNDGNTAIVGAPNEDTGSNNKGSAYIFTRSGTSWSQQAKIQTSVSNAGSFGKFGESVSISEDGNIVLVGHKGYEQFARNDEGAAHIFTRSGTTWTEQATIQASDRQNYDEFGLSVSISADGETAIVGGHKEDTGGTDAGAAYIFIAG